MLAAACGELSSNPGADAGTESLRVKCASCAGPEALFRCIAGECVPTCRSDFVEGLCLPSERCLDALCLRVEQPSCADRPCNADQTCFNGSCTALGNRECSTTDSTCPIDFACAPELGRCVELVPCAADRTCLRGDRGAICNTDPFGERRSNDTSGYRCLFGRCASNGDCPAPLTCVDIGAEARAPSLGWCR